MIQPRHDSSYFFIDSTPSPRLTHLSRSLIQLATLSLSSTDLPSILLPVRYSLDEVEEADVFDVDGRRPEDVDQGAEPLLWKSGTDRQCQTGVADDGTG